MQKQNEITEMLVKEQVLTPLSKEIPVFKGNPLQYMSVICTSECYIEDKTTNDGDRLFFLDQYTEGQPKAVLPKLPFKLREKWRSVAYEHYERTKERAKFIQLVNIIEIQANMAGNPLFGNIQDVMPKEDRKKKSQNKIWLSLQE